ncbi:MAG: hypothetical protein ACI8UD_003023 [Planctomycetota bacterium]|jgi:hypothetical protein
MLLDMRTLLVTLAGIATGFALPHADPTQEPPLHFDVQIDGATHPVAEGKKTSIKIGDAEHQLTVAVSPLRHFEAHGMQFNYPRNANFEYELDNGTESWTLETNNLTLILHHFGFVGGKATAKSMLDSMLEGFKTDARAKPRNLVFGSKTYQGTRATMTIGDSDLEVTTIGFDLNGKAVVITIQNMLTDDGKLAPDSVAAMAVIQKTFQLAAK